MDQSNKPYEAMLGLAAEMLLDDAVRKFHAEKIYQAIDCALATGDRDTFQQLTDALKHRQAL